MSFGGLLRSEGPKFQAEGQEQGVHWEGAASPSPPARETGGVLRQQIHSGPTKSLENMYSVRKCWTQFNFLTNGPSEPLPWRHSCHLDVKSSIRLRQLTHIRPNFLPTRFKTTEPWAFLKSSPQQEEEQDEQRYEISSW